MRSRLKLLALVTSVTLLLACSMSIALLLTCSMSDFLDFFGRWTGFYPKSFAVALGDVDGDGDLDAYVANGHTDDLGKENAVWLNNGSGRFRDSGQRLGKVDSYSVTLGDFDADGDLDALIGNSLSCETLKNDGRGRFITQRWLSVPEDSGAHSWAVALGDLDGDGGIA